MPRSIVRMLMLLVALGTLSLPALTAPSSVSACAQPSGGCTVTITGGSTWDTFVSPLTATVGTAVFSETQTMAELPPSSTVTIFGSLSFTVFDLRGNGGAWFASITSGGFSSSRSPLLSIPGSDVSIDTTHPITGVRICLGPTCPPGYVLVYCPPDSPPIANCLNGLPLDLSSPVQVGGACPFTSSCPPGGIGIYEFFVPLRLTVTGLLAEDIAAYPVNWSGSFTLTITEVPAGLILSSSGVLEF